MTQTPSGWFFTPFEEESIRTMLAEAAQHIGAPRRAVVNPHERRLTPRRIAQPATSRVVSWRVGIAGDKVIHRGHVRTPYCHPDCLPTFHVRATAEKWADAITEIIQADIDAAVLAKAKGADTSYVDTD